MATLTSTKIKNTYDALLKASDNDAIGSSAKQITDGLGNGTPLYISTTQIGIGVTPEATYDLHVYSNAKVGGNLTVTGDLTVEGTTTTIDTQTLTVEDPLIEVASNNTSTDAVDIGWYGKYAPSGTTLYAGLFRDTGDSKFKLFRNLEEQPTTTVNTSGTGYTKATLVIGGLEATTGDFTDTVTVDGDIEVENSSGFGRIEIGGSSGGYIDLKSPFSDDFDLRLYTAGTNAQINAINGELDITAYTNINLQYQGTDVLVMSSTGVAVTGTGSFTGQVTIPETPVADTDAASKGYVDSLVEGQDTLAEILGNGNTTGGTDIAVGSGDDITFTDTSKAYFGTGNDLQIYHDGSTSDIWNYTGDLRIRNDSNDSNIDIAASNEAGTGSQIYIRANGSTGAAELFHYSYKKFETTSTGVQVTGDISIPVSNKLLFGGGNHTYISEDIDDRLRFFVGGAEFMRFTEGVSDTINFYQDVTFSGDLIVPEYIKHEGDADTSIRFTTNTIRFYTANNEVLELESDGQVNVISSGTATNPCITIGDDVNTGIWRPALDTFAVSTAGSERMRIDSSGNTTFTGDVTVNNDGDGKITIGGASGLDIIHNNAGNTIAEIKQLYASTSASAQMKLTSGFTTFHTGTSGTERMRITSGGKVGIGLNPTGFYADQLVVNEGMTLYSTGNSFLCFADGTSGDDRRRGEVRYEHSSNTMAFMTDADTRMTIDSSGNVGIGVTSPNYKLHLEGSIGVKRISVAATSTIDMEGNFNFDAASGYSHVFKQAGSEKVRILPSGNVGIGTTSPDYLLHLEKSGTIMAQLKATDSNQAYMKFVNSTTGDGAFTDGLLFGLDTDESAVLWNYEATALRFATSGTERMRITSGGQLFLFTQTSGAGNATLKYTTGTGAVTYDTSSRLVKEDIVDIPYGLDTVLALSPKKYRRIDSDDKIEIGFIADEVQEVVPELVGMMEKKIFTKNEDDTEIIAGSIEYEKMTSILVKAIQELKADNDSLRARIETLENN